MKKTNVIGMGLVAALWLGVASCGQAPKQENFDNNGREWTRTTPVRNWIPTKRLLTPQKKPASTKKAAVRGTVCKRDRVM